MALLLPVMKCFLKKAALHEGNVLHQSMIQALQDRLLKWVADGMSHKEGELCCTHISCCPCKLW